MSPEIRQRLQAYPAFFAGMAVLVALALAGSIALGREQAAWKRAGRALAHKQRELVKLTAAVDAAPTVELETLHVGRERARTELFGGAAAVAGAVPVGRIEAYADLTAFVVRSRAQAVQAGVALAADERFGFGQFAREGPALAAVPGVWRQRVALEPLLEALWAARPQSLAGVWCEAEGSLGVPGLVETDCYRVAFVGGTACLRRYLATLAGAARPVVVREVRAEPLRAEIRPGGARPIQFTVTLEVLSPVGPVLAPEAGAVVAQSTPVWAEPREQAAGPGWRFEVFEPPVIEYAKERREWALVGAGPALVPAKLSGPAAVAVPPAPYRWRLVGHGGVGAGEGGWVVLEDARTGRTVRLRRGEADGPGAITLADWRLVRTKEGVQVAEACLRAGDGTERWLRAGVPALETGLPATARQPEAERP